MSRHTPHLAVVVSFVVLLVTAAMGCGGTDSPTSPSPTPPAPPTPTRIIGLAGSLAFGNVTVRQTATASFTISNSGSATLTWTGITNSSPALLAVSTISPTGGTVAAGESATVTMSFTPDTAQSYGGTLTVAGDQTSGTNTISVSGTGIPTPTPPRPPTPPPPPPPVPNFQGQWIGLATVINCAAVGQFLITQPLFCTMFAVGTVHPMSLSLTQNGTLVSGTLKPVFLAAGTAVSVTGSVGSGGHLTLTGGNSRNDNGSVSSARISGFDAVVNGSSMRGAWQNTGTFSSAGLTGSGAYQVAFNISR
jgi:hypothetical protein